MSTLIEKNNDSSPFRLIQVEDGGRMLPWGHKGVAVSPDVDPGCEGKLVLGHLRALLVLAED
jgi:hypothetical protein